MLVVGIIFAPQLFAQTDAQFSQHYEVPSVYNPAAIGNTDYIALGHYPEHCMAWLDVIDKYEYTDSDKKLVFIKDNS